MQLKISLKSSLLVVGIAGIVCSSVVIFFVGLPSIGSNSQGLVSGKSVVFPGQANSGSPTRLKIPKINVDAAVESVGLTSDGEMDAPKGITNVAWFNLGPRPGENGSAVIDGHFGWKNGAPTVFNNLSKLQTGDKLDVEDSNGVTTAFVVRELRSYDPKADASDVFSSSDGKTHLNLITCEGVWNETVKQYPKRLVVFTDKEME